MTRDEMLTSIEAFLDLPVGPLTAYADEDTLGGFNFDAGVSKWPGGSLWAVEGETLYALMRALKPTVVLELGTHRGCSTSHLAAAALRNGKGRVIAVDIWEGAGDLIPADLKSVVEQQFGDAVDVITRLPDNSISFVFEDLLHGAEQVAAVIEALKPKLTSRAIVVHHDSEHGDDGVKIRRGIELAGVTKYVSLLAAPSDCGLAIWRGETKAAEQIATYKGIDGEIKSGWAKEPDTDKPEIIQGQVAKKKLPAPVKKPTARKAAPKK